MLQLCPLLFLIGICHTLETIFDMSDLKSLVSIVLTTTTFLKLSHVVKTLAEQCLTNMWAVQEIILLLLLMGYVAASLSPPYYSLDLESTQSCLLISKDKIWPFAGHQTQAQPNLVGVAPNAKRICNELGAAPAILESPAENLDLRRWKGFFYNYIFCWPKYNIYLL